MRRKEREVTEREEILEIFREADACRVAFAVENEPYIVCMNYGYTWEGDTPVLYFHCAREGLKLRMMELNNRVCFQLDASHKLRYDETTIYCTMDYSSVVGKGILEKIEDTTEIKKGLDLLMEHHGHKAPEAYPASSMARVTVLKLSVTELTAKRK